MVLVQNRHTEQWNRIQSPEVNPNTYDQLIYDKGGTYIQWIKDSLFNRWCWENLTATHKTNNEIRTFSHTIYKSKFKWVKDLNVSLKILKLLEENRQNTLLT